MNNSATIALTKQSNQHEIRAYFEGVMRIANSNEQFPVNLDEVWPLVYESKQKAVNELKNTQNEDGTPRYIQGVDYQSLSQKVPAGHTMSTVHNHYLSVSCIEWFIARKVRPVFEVSRQVFHKAVARPAIDFSNPDTVLMLAQNWKIEQEKRIAA